MNNQQAFSVGYESGYYDCHHSGVKKLDLRWRQNRDEFDSVALREQIEKPVTEYENTQPANWLDSDKHDEEKREAIGEYFFCYRRRINSLYARLDETICDKLYDDGHREDYLKRITLEIEASKAYFVDQVFNLITGAENE